MLASRVSRVGAWMVKELCKGVPLFTSFLAVDFMWISPRSSWFSEIFSTTKFFLILCCYVSLFEIQHAKSNIAIACVFAFRIHIL